MNRKMVVAVLTAVAMLVVPIVVSAMTAAECHDLMRKLWTDHALWTRQYTISALSNLPDKAAAAQRLMQNQTDIGNAIKPFYGDAAGTQLTNLLKQHIAIAVELIDAQKAADTTKTDDAMKRWEANGDQIAAFLSTANPKNWPLEDVKAMLREHLDLTGAQVEIRLQKDWAQDAINYDNIYSEILKMADALSAGIVAQFPDKFTK